MLGAGPAGATLAARLARLGHDVAVVDRDAVATAEVGESLSPGVLPLLDDLGVAAAVDAARFVRAPRARVRWRSGDRGHTTPGRDGLTVDRPRFDAILRSAARAAGARMLPTARAGRPRQVPGGWVVPLPGGPIHARLIADATGRRRLTGGRRRATGSRTMALHATWTQVSAAEPQSCVDVLEQGWLWGAHRPDGTFRAMAFVDLDALVDRDRRYRKLVDASPLFAELLRGARPGPVRVCDATGYVVDDPVADDLVRVGDAALALDPLSACGVQVAMQTAAAAAAVVHTLLVPDGDRAAARRYYTDLLAHTSARHAATAAALYAEHDAYAAHAFWRHRAARAPAAAAPAPPDPARLRTLLAHPVRLDPAAAVTPQPCLVDDQVRMYRALSHPALDRPVAFLGRAPLAALLDVLPAASDLAGAARVWDVATGGRGLRVAAWLADRGLLEPVIRPGPEACGVPQHGPRRRI